jgi:hypothetical protein
MPVRWNTEHPRGDAAECQVGQTRPPVCGHSDQVAARRPRQVGDGCRGATRRDPHHRSRIGRAERARDGSQVPSPLGKLNLDVGRRDLRGVTLYQLWQRLDDAVQDQLGSQHLGELVGRHPHRQF